MRQARHAQARISALSRNVQRLSDLSNEQFRVFHAFSEATEGLPRRLVENHHQLSTIMPSNLPPAEESSRLIVETIPGLIAVMTPRGEVEHVNRQVLDYFGRTLEELKKWGTTDAVHPTDLPQVRV